MQFVDRFIVWGERVFSPGAWHRAAFQPILYLFLWGATVRLAVSDTYPPIAFEQVIGAWATGVWLTTSLACPPLALVAWFLISRSRWPRSALVGMWVRFGADVGQLMALVAAHAATALTAANVGVTEGRVYSRYVMGAAIMFMMLLVVRDVWALTATERLAWQIRRRQR